MKALKIGFISVLLISLTIFSFADEGMWLPHQMRDLNLKALGLKMDPGDLYRKDGKGLMSAIVHLGGGTGELVSSEGLILTNHHVAFGALQRSSTKEKDYIRSGFLALTREEEIPAKGYIADVLLGYEEVTDQILTQITPHMSYKQKYYAIDRIKKKLIAQAEKEGKDIRATAEINTIFFDLKESRIFALFLLLPKTWGISVGISTIGCGLATPLIFPSCGRMSLKIMWAQISVRIMFLISQNLL